VARDQREVVRASRVAASPEVAPIFDLFVTAKHVAKSFDGRDECQRCVEARHGDQDVENRLGAEIRDRGAANMVNLEDRRGDRGNELRCSELEESGQRES
jgi:hypothetical protein